MRLAPLLAALLLAACSPAKPPAYSSAGIAVAEPFSRPAPAGGTGAGFFSVTNNNSGPDVLIAVESPVAARVQMHETSTAGGMMRMEELKDGVRFKAGETVDFKPGGKHVMFIDLARPLKAGDRIPATLVFRNAGRAPIELVVRGAPSRGMAGMANHDH
ncbi:MAG TPA: copper chaperone PCu(A)C [Caulobacter sp.]|nr:copper chaperone PCu(A)C [Caulobacter sp.]